MRKSKYLILGIHANVLNIMIQQGTCKAKASFFMQICKQVTGK